MLALAALLLVFVVAGQPGFAQYRNLPKAGFQTFTSPGGGNTELPVSTGLYLRPGMNRSPKNMAAPYDPRHPQLGFVRWERKKMPLHIWIAPGLKLPDVPLSDIKETRVDLVRDMLRTTKPFSGLEQAPGWTPEMNDIVAAGIEEWREFETEGLISFDFTEDPRLAHILIFFTDTFKEADAPGGVTVGGNTCSQPLPIDKAKELAAAGKEMVPLGWVQPGRNVMQNPVVIELATMINSSEGKLRGASAHEFGHALGIIEHSPYREDLMYVDRVVEDLSPGDKATFRALYHTNPQGVL